MTETTWLVRERRVVSRKINWPGNSRFYLSICHYFYLSLNQTGDLSFFSWCFTWEALLCRYPSSCPLWNDKIIFSSVRENVRSRCLIPPSTSACLGNRTLRSHPPKDISHVPDFSRGMLHSGYLVYLSIIHMLIQEIFIFNTNKVNPMFLPQVVYSPAAEINACTWPDTHWSCSSERPHWQDPLVTVLRFICLVTEDHVIARRRFLGGKTIEWWPFPWLMSKHIVFSGAVPVEARKQKKVHWTPRTWPTGRNVASGSGVLL